MSEDRQDSARARDEAAAWHARLGRRAVTTQELRDFRAWKRQPLNAAAFAQVERVWRLAGDLRHDPDLRAAADEAMAGRPRRARIGRMLGRRRVALAFAGVAAAMLVLFLVGAALVQPAYSTGVGEQRLVLLRDGSRIHLNTDSRVRVAYGRTERRIRLLRGEALFEAAHDPSRPFVVDAGAATVRALGTRFDVRRDGARVQVTLLEGKVEVAKFRGGDRWTLAPRQQLTLAPGQAAAAPVSADVERASSWTAGRLVFRETPLADAVAEVNRYAVRKVELQAPDLAGSPVSGVFETGDAEAFAAAAAELFDLKVVRDEDGHSVLIPARP